MAFVPSSRSRYAREAMPNAPSRLPAPRSRHPLAQDHFLSDWFSIGRMRSRLTVERATDLVERARRLAVQPEAGLEHAPLTIAQRLEAHRQGLVAERHVGLVL